MDLATAWKAFGQIVRDGQAAVEILREYFRKSTGEVIPDIVLSEAMLVLLEKLESTLSEQATEKMLQGLRPLFPAVNVIGAEPGAFRWSDVGPCLNRLRDAVQGFADDLLQDVADGNLRLRVRPRYLTLRKQVKTLTMLGRAYSTSPRLEQAGESAAEVGEPAAPGRVRQSMLPWPKHIKTDRERLKFLDDHKAEIPNESKGKRRMVDAAAFISYWAKHTTAAFESLESGEPKPVVPESVSTEQYLENVVPLLQEVAGTKTKRRKKP